MQLRSPSFRRATSRSAGTLAPLLLVAAAATGCARGEGASERQLAQLREEIGRVQADRDRFEQRVIQLELQQGDRKGLLDGEGARAPSRASDAGAGTPTPALRVVHLQPSEDSPTPLEAAVESSAEAEDQGPRPVLRVVGTPAPSVRRPLRSIDRSPPRADDPDEAHRPPEAPRPSALDPEAKKAYDAAYALLTTQKLDRALDAFAAFLVRYPDHPYAENATFWRGEAYFAQGEWLRAAEQFEGVLARFPGGAKVPDALLKLGMAQIKLGNPDKARAVFERLRREHPRSDAARRAPTSTQEAK